MTAHALICDHCCAFRGFAVAGGARPAPGPEALRGHPLLGAFVAEHEECRPGLRVAGVDDPHIEGYREHYEEA